jgi:hypothetical protein
LNIVYEKKLSSGKITDRYYAKRIAACKEHLRSRNILSCFRCFGKHKTNDIEYRRHYFQLKIPDFVQSLDWMELLEMGAAFSAWEMGTGGTGAVIDLAQAGVTAGLEIGQLFVDFNYDWSVYQTSS